MSAVFTCPKKLGRGRCGAPVQMTRKVYLTLDEENGNVLESSAGESWDAYCENDHQLGSDFDGPDDVREFLRTYNVSQKVEVKQK